jgi:hypothetical protein
MDGLLFSGMRWNFFNIKQDGRCGKYRISLIIHFSTTKATCLNPTTTSQERARHDQDKITSSRSRLCD